MVGRTLSNPLMDGRSAFRRFQKAELKTTGGHPRITFEVKFSHSTSRELPGWLPCHLELVTAFVAQFGWMSDDRWTVKIQYRNPTTFCRYLCLSHNRKEKDNSSCDYQTHVSIPKEPVVTSHCQTPPVRWLSTLLANGGRSSLRNQITTFLSNFCLGGQKGQRISHKSNKLESHSLLHEYLQICNDWIRFFTLFKLINFKIIYFWIKSYYLWAK